MRMVLVVLAASILGAERPEGNEAPKIRYQVKVLEMEGLQWRSTLQPQLQAVARQGAATVWTASHESAAAITEKAGRIELAPRAICQPEVRATIFHKTTRKLVTEVAREADGPVNHATLVDFVPQLEDANAGYSFEVSGRPLDQGILTRLTLDDRAITAVHLVALNETLEAKADRDEEATPVKTTIQVAEYARTTVNGEWLIPKNGALLISLGVHTISDPSGKAIVRERLALFEAETVNDSTTVAAGPANIRLSATEPGIALNRRKSAIPLPNTQPAMPSRSLPQPIDASGLPVALPPLPDDEPVATRLPGGMTPCPSPQASPSAVAAGDPLPWKKSEIRDTKPTEDPAMTRAGFAAEDADCDCESDETCPVKAANPPAVPTLKKPIEPNAYQFTLPLGKNAKLEVNVRVNPATTAKP